MTEHRTAEAIEELMFVGDIAWWFAVAMLAGIAGWALGASAFTIAAYYAVAAVAYLRTGVRPPQRPARPRS